MIPCLLLLLPRFVLCTTSTTSEHSAVLASLRNRSILAFLLKGLCWRPARNVVDRHKGLEHLIHNPPRQPPHTLTFGTTTTTTDSDDGRQNLGWNCDDWRPVLTRQATRPRPLTKSWKAPCRATLERHDHGRIINQCFWACPFLSWCVTSAICLGCSPQRTHLRIST